MNKKFLAATFTLSGTIIGAGILGLPYVFAKSGFLIGILWLIILGSIMIFVNLALGEVTLRTKERHQLSGYARKYLGKWGQKAMFFSVMFGIYSALLAYLIGEGNSLSKIIPLNLPPVVFGFLFWLIMTVLLREGIKGLKKVETWGVFGIILIVVGIFIKYLPIVETSNIVTYNPSNFILPIGIVLFALLGFTAIPELRQEIKGEEKLFKKAIILGSLIPIILYILFSFTFIGVLGKTVSEVATLSFGPIVIILGIFTMLTSFFVLSFSLKDTFKYDMNVSKTTSFALASLLPLILYILAEQFQMNSFSLILGIGGTISGGVTGILILLMAKRAKEKTLNKRPKINIPINWPIIIILSIIFITAIILEFIR